MSDPIAHRTPGFGGTMTRSMPTSRARRNPWVGPAPPKGRSANRSRSTALRAMSGTRAAYIWDVATRSTASAGARAPRPRPPPRLARRAADDRDVGAGAARVEGDHALVAGLPRDERRPDDAGRGP